MRIYVNDCVRCHAASARAPRRAREIHCPSARCIPSYSIRVRHTPTIFRFNTVRDDDRRRPTCVLTRQCTVDTARTRPQHTRSDSEHTTPNSFLTVCVRLRVRDDAWPSEPCRAPMCTEARTAAHIWPDSAVRIHRPEDKDREPPACFV